MANVDSDVTPSFRVTLSCILIVSLWLVVVLCPPINVLKLPTCLFCLATLSIRKRISDTSSSVAVPNKLLETVPPIC